MIHCVLIIGGYGNFGCFIARMLAREETIQLIIAGRHQDKAERFCATLHAVHQPESTQLDIRHDLDATLLRLRPNIVIHTSGPYQNQTYHVAQACIRQGCHYIDLADARQFVADISTLNNDAREKNILVCSGASSVPCLTGAIVDHYKGEFQTLESLHYAIATAQLTNRGLATTSAALSYAGKRFKTVIDGKSMDIYGWLDLRVRRFWKLNKRCLGNCDIPDLEIFPSRYPDLKTICFQAGLELKFLHLGLWALSCLVRWRLFPALQRFAPLLLKFSAWGDPFGHDDSGFYMTLRGTGHTNKPKVITFDLVAHHADGLYIPSMPAILLAKKLARGEIVHRGAQPCLDLITLEEYLAALGEFDIHWQTTKT